MMMYDLTGGFIPFMEIKSHLIYGNKVKYYYKSSLNKYEVYEECFQW